MGKTAKITACPYCMEEIAPGAIICKHCHTPLKLPQRKKKAPLWRCSYMLGVYSGIALAILLFILYNKLI